MGANEVFVGDESDWITTEFFAPAATDLVDGLIGQYRRMRLKIEEVSALVTGETAGAVSYFLDGAGDRQYGSLTVERIFQLDHAVAALNAAYWAKAMNMTDVLDAMPQARRDEWNKSIRDHATPEFEEETVRATLQDLLMSRSKFFAERVDGIFRSLSGEHVTNSPMGFSKRMIIANACNDWGHADYRTSGVINDLRAVIARFMGRDEPGHSATGPVVDIARKRHGEWITIDGGAMRIRVYIKGTAHLEVHPDMAWRLNCVLAQMHPSAIPSEFRKKPQRKARDIEMIQRPLPFAVLSELASMEEAIGFVDPEGTYQRRTCRIPMTRRFRYGNSDKHARNEAEQILAGIGAVKQKGGEWLFDYDPADVLAEIVCSGCVPDRKSHQFYPTPERLARIAVDLAEIGELDMCLEPSAGTGGIANLLPPERTRCVEISKLHCDILSAKGFPLVACDDFMTWSELPGHPGYDKVVMNPPFDQGRWQAHLQRAAGLVTPEGGRLVAILPASAQGKDVLPGWGLTWHGPYAGEFAGTGVSVVILVADPA